MLNVRDYGFLHSINPKYLHHFILFTLCHLTDNLKYFIGIVYDLSTQQQENHTPKTEILTLSLFCQQVP